jgi:hypothetical protein
MPNNILKNPVVMELAEINIGISDVFRGVTNAILHSHALQTHSKSHKFLSAFALLIL